MQVKILGGTGLHTSERKAVARMEQELRDSWYAYASLLIADDQGSMDIDVLIITHDRLLLVELKEWNGKLESSDSKWYINGKYRSKSPYETKRVHALRLTKLLESELKHKLGYYPLVEAHVVLCGSSNPNNLSTSERRFVHTLDEFLEIRKADGYSRITADQSKAMYAFEKGQRPRPNSIECLPTIQDFFSGPRITSKNFEHFNYAAEKTCWFEHKNGIYQEFKGHHKETPNLHALMRRWDFNRLGTGYATQEQWASIALRETRILNYVKANGNQLEDYMLKPLVPLSEQDITEDISELYELRRTYIRFDEFLAKEASIWTKEKRADLTRTLIVPFAELHGLGLGHRDIEGHNLWFASEQGSVVISGLATAFFPERGTVRDLRLFLQSSNCKLPEDEFAASGDILDPFRQDVYMLAIIAYQICFAGASIPKEDSIAIWKTPIDDVFNGVLNDWFEKALSWDSESRYSNALEMLAEFNKITKGFIPNNEDKFEVYDELINNDFIRRNWSIFSIFQNYPPLPGENPSSDSKMVYKTEANNLPLLCKVWSQVKVSTDSIGLNRKLLQFKQRLLSINEKDLPLPQLYDFGLLEGGGLFVVTKYINGSIWSSDNLKSLEKEKKLLLAEALVKAVKRLHSQHIAHGDLHPNNIIIQSRDDDALESESNYPYNLALIDSVDFGEVSEPYNTEYSPSNPSITDSFGRDRFACYKLINELFEFDKIDVLEKEMLLSKSAEHEVPPSLDPLEAAINYALKPEATIKEEKLLLIEFPHGSFPDMEAEFEQDEGRYYFNCKWDTQRAGVFNCYITGISSQLHISLNLDSGENDRSISYVQFKKKIPLSEVVSASSKSRTHIKDKIYLKNATPQDDSLRVINYLLDLDVVIDELAKKYHPSGDGESTKIESGYEGEEALPTVNLWEALISTEQDLLQCLEIENESIEESSSGNIIVRYKLPHANSLNFEKDDQIFVSIQGEDGHIGELDLLETNLDYLAIKPKRSLIRRNLSFTKSLYLESVRSKASRDRREKALQRIIHNEAEIFELKDYFDKNMSPPKKQYKITPSEEGLRKLYDTDNVKMNAKQIEAFRTLLENGPIGALQGPPGTGKTAFISKFIHYLFAECKVNNILLVGQSHTAVDNVAIKVREICADKCLDISLVRIGQETMIDEELLHAHPSSLQRQIRQKFHREYDQRVQALSSQLLLPSNLVAELAFLHRTLYPLIKSYEHLILASGSAELSNNSPLSFSSDEKNSQLLAVKGQIESILENRFNGNFGEVGSFESLWNDLSLFVAAQHGINNPSGLNRLKSLLSLSQEWMEVLHTGDANYDKFLVSTRQLVCGTLVGVGQRSIEIENLSFDWVIVDEAGRAQASELMIALQSAKRILLVGDQKQLPPFYEKQHLKLAAKKMNCSFKVFNESDFYKAFNANNGVALDTQYRSVKQIGDIVSACFYSDDVGELKTGRGDSPEWYGALPSPWNMPVTWINSHTSSDGEEEVEKGKYINKNEVYLVKKLLQLLSNQETIKMLSDTVSKEQAFPIGIITMYQAQKELLENELSKSEWVTPLRHLIKIDTVDSYQGKENKIIILSLVRDNDKYLQGFLSDSPRVNVAVSRAQERLIILGSTKMWNSANTDSALGRVYEHINNGVNQKTTGYQILDTKDFCKEADYE